MFEALFRMCVKMTCDFHMSPSRGIGPLPIQLVVVIAVSAAVIAATMILSTSSTIFPAFITFEWLAVNG